MSGEVDDPFAPAAGSKPKQANAPVAAAPPPTPQKRKTQFDHGDPFAPPSQKKAESVEDNKRVVGFLVTFDDGAALGKHWVLREGRTLLGSDPDVCQVVIENDTNVSGKHAVMVFRNGKLRINDEMSTNGTYLNGDDIEQPTEVTTGSVIGLGRTTRLVCLLLDPAQVQQLWKVGGAA
jgi:hypothetical protein